LLGKPEHHHSVKLLKTYHWPRQEALMC
jgi:hypothetical protein